MRLADNSNAVYKVTYTGAIDSMVYTNPTLTLPVAQSGYYYAFTANGMPISGAILQLGSDTIIHVTLHQHQTAPASQPTSWMQPSSASVPEHSPTVGTPSVPTQLPTPTPRPNIRVVTTTPSSGEHDVSVIKVTTDVEGLPFEEAYGKNPKVTASYKDATLRNVNGYRILDSAGNPVIFADYNGDVLNFIATGYGDYTIEYVGLPFSEWATDSMRRMMSVGVMRGREDGTIDPQGNATRGEVAAMLARYVRLVLK